MVNVKAYIKQLNFFKIAYTISDKRTDCSVLQGNKKLLPYRTE